MHPAKSVIFFTTASGAGYGMLVWLAILAATGLQEAAFHFGFWSFAIAFSLIVGGLLSSTFHLGHPERAWRAMSQWRSSWLSREGLAAIVTFIPTGLFGLSWIFLGINESFAGQFGLFGAIMSMVTVYCTAMIYGSLKTIPAWYTPWTRAAYLVFALMTGAIAIFFLAVLFDIDTAPLIGRIALFFLATGIVVKFFYWRSIDDAPATSTAESATGLGELGKIRLVERPHSEDNYLLKEMGFRIARKHARKLRAIAYVAAFVLPFIFIAFSVYGPFGVGLIAASLATASAIIGIVTERWLFFAEARHVVTLYYGETKI